MNSRASDAFQVGARAALASVLAVYTVERMGLPYPFYAMVAAVIVTDMSAQKTRHLGHVRMIGNALGATIGAVCSAYVSTNLFALGACIFIALFLCSAFDPALQETAKMAAYVSGIVILAHSDSPWRYAFDRFVETAVGIIFALLLGFIWDVAAAKTRTLDRT